MQTLPHSVLPILLPYCKNGNTPCPASADFPNSTNGKCSDLATDPNLSRNLAVETYTPKPSVHRCTHAERQSPHMPRPCHVTKYFLHTNSVWNVVSTTYWLQCAQTFCPGFFIRECVCTRARVSTLVDWDTPRDPSCSSSLPLTLSQAWGFANVHCCPSGDDPA